MARWFQPRSPETSENAPHHSSSRQSSTYVSPESIRQPAFESDDEEEEHHQPPRSASDKRLTTAAIKALKTRLVLEDIPSWIVDFKAAIGRTDPEAATLLAATNHQSELLGTSGSTWAFDANKRIANVIDSALDPVGDNVILLKSTLRDAEAGDRPGILASGVDMLAEIQALLTERTYGEIKLDKEVTAAVVFVPGATVTETRLIAEKIKRRQVLKTHAEQAIPKALLHEIISKIPDTPEALRKHKNEYERKLYKTEMIGTSPPWTANELIAFIGVDLTAYPRPEVSLTERPPTGGVTKQTLNPETKCGNCGATSKHVSRDCPIKCPDCLLNCCPGNPARGMLCAAKCDIAPSKCIPPLTSFNGRDLPTFCVQKLDTAWKAKHPGKEISSLERDLEHFWPSSEPLCEEISSLELISDDGYESD